MKSVLDVEVSCFRSYTSNEPRSVNLLTWLSSDKYAGEILELRDTTDKAQRDQIKASLPAVTVSGIFDPVRKEECLIQHSGLICLDVDPKGNEGICNFEELKLELFKIRNIAYAGLSASGKGFFVIIPIAYPKRHKQHFKALLSDLSRFGIAIDPAPQNVASLRGYSFDPDALFRYDAIPYRKWSRPKKGNLRIDVGFIPSSNTTGTRAKVEAVIRNITDRRIDITSSEPDWFRLACSLANEFGEDGREYFHAVSQFYSRYDRGEADKKYSNALKRRYSAIGIGTFFKLASHISL